MSKLSADLSRVTRVGLDLAKSVFQVHAVDAAGAELDKRAIRRGKLIAYFAALPPCTIGITVADVKTPKSGIPVAVRQNDTRFPCIVV